SVSGSKVSGTVASATAAGTATTAGNVSGVVGIPNGGTNANNAGTARTNLGLGSLATVTPTGTANNTTFLRGDNTWASSSDSTIFTANLVNPSALTFFAPITGFGGSGTALTYIQSAMTVPFSGTIDQLRVVQLPQSGTTTTSLTVTLVVNNATT